MEPRRIPLFPLNVVLFPGMPLPLHVFEPRYRQMVRHCLEGERTFGVCLIRSGREVGGPAEPHAVGTLCEIVSVDVQDDGRIYLMTLGRERFRVRRLFTDQPYLEAEVEALPAEEPGEPGTLPERVREAAARYVAAILALMGEPDRAVPFPDEPRALSFAVASLLQVSPPHQQALLETTVTADRLRRELELLDEELEKLAAVTSLRAAAVPYHPSAQDLEPN
jgi:uncharacterized protein